MLPRLSKVAEFIEVAVTQELTDAEIRSGVLKRWPGVTEADLATVDRLVAFGRREGWVVIAGHASSAAYREAVAEVGRDPEAIVVWLLKHRYASLCAQAQAQGVADLFQRSLTESIQDFHTGEARS